MIKLIGATMEQTISIRIKCLKPNAGKGERLAHQQREFVHAANWFLDRIEALGTTSRKQLHRELYSSAREQFDLNAGVLQCA
ncbi:MAG: hypothetical protein ACE5JP_10495, partial [Candidatus Bipolaricaulia bacterium]